MNKDYIYSISREGDNPVYFKDLTKLIFYSVAKVNFNKSMEDAITILSIGTRMCYKDQTPTPILYLADYLSKHEDLESFSKLSVWEQLEQFYEEGV